MGVWALRVFGQGETVPAEWRWDDRWIPPRNRRHRPLFQGHLGLGFGQWWNGMRGPSRSRESIVGDPGQGPQAGSWVGVGSWVSDGSAKSHSVAPGGGRGRPWVGALAAGAPYCRSAFRWGLDPAPIDRNRGLLLARTAPRGPAASSRARQGFSGFSHPPYLAATMGTVCSPRVFSKRAAYRQYSPGCRCGWGSGDSSRGFPAFGVATRAGERHWRLGMSPVAGAELAMG